MCHVPLSKFVPVWLSDLTVILTPPFPPHRCISHPITCAEKVVGAKAEEVLGESARDLHVPQGLWTEDVLEGHEQFVKDLRAMGDRAAPIVEKVKKREELVQVGGTWATSKGTGLYSCFASLSG